MQDQRLTTMTLSTKQETAKAVNCSVFYTAEVGKDCSQARAKQTSHFVTNLHSGQHATKSRWTGYSETADSCARNGINLEAMTHTETSR